MAAYRERRREVDLRECSVVVWEILALRWVDLEICLVEAGVRLLEGTLCCHMDMVRRLRASCLASGELEVVDCLGRLVDCLAG